MSDIATHAAELKDNISRNVWSLVSRQQRVNIDGVGAIASRSSANVSRPRHRAQARETLAHRAAERDERANEEAKTVRRAVIRRGGCS